MGLADDITDLLVTGGLSSTVHVGELLERPTKAVAVTPYAGLQTLRSFNGAVLEQVRIQVRARASDYPTVEDLMSSAHGKLDGAKDKTINGRLYYWMEALQPPFYIGRDEEERSIFAFNLNVLRSATT